jgi:uncharacterized membrane protein YuzA (DUF378 family)
MNPKLSDDIWGTATVTLMMLVFGAPAILFMILYILVGINVLAGKLSQ